MNQILEINRNLLFQKIFAFTMLLCGSVACSFKDNATELAYELETASKTLKSQKEGTEYILHYEPSNKTEPYLILILPENGITSDELISEGLDSAIVRDLYPQLSYIDLKNRATIIVFQESTISFTSYYRRFVDVSEIQIVNATGGVDLVVKKIGMTGPHLDLDTDRVLIELY